VVLRRHNHGAFEIVVYPWLNDCVPAGKQLVDLAAVYYK
jgi:hypothetical protein